MKNYFNKDEMAALVFVSLLGDIAKSISASWDKRGNLTDAEAGQLAAVYNGANEFLLSVLQRMRPDQEERYLRHCKENEVYIRPRMTAWEYKMMVQREMEQDKILGTWIENETAAALADLMLFKNCNPCCQSACDRKVCPIRKVLLQMDIPVFDENASGDKCPYDNGGE